MSYPLATLREFEAAIDALDDASAQAALARELGSTKESVKAEAEFDRAREHLISLCQAILSRKQ